MLTFNNKIISDLLAESLETASFDGKDWTNPIEGHGSPEGQYINFLAFDNLEKSVVDDVSRVRSHPLVPGNIPIYGYIYDVKSGKLIEVPEATEIGKVK
jgi:carbonic anhydrase